MSARDDLIEAMDARWQEAQQNGEWEGYTECLNGLLDAALAHRGDDGRLTIVDALIERGVLRPVVLSGGNYPDEGGPTVLVACDIEEP